VDPKTLLAYAAVILTGGIAAVINSLAGGGTFLTFPALTGLAGLSEKVANMTSTVGLWPGTVASLAAAKEDLNQIPRSLLRTFAIISFAGGLAGSLLLIYTSNNTFRLVIPWLLGFATVLFGFSKPIAAWAASHGAHAGHTSKRWTFLVALLQLGVAIYGGYFGAGIGVLMLAGLSFAGLENLHQVNAMKVFLNCIINLITLVVFVLCPLFLRTGDSINWPLAIGMAILSAVGGFVGMKLARKMKPAKLRLVILTIGILLTCVYFYKGYLPQPPSQRGTAAFLMWHSRPRL